MLPLYAHDAAQKPQGAPGLNINAVTMDGRRVVGEIKATVPYKGSIPGSAQLTTWLKDFAKLRAADAPFKHFFVTDRVAFDAVAGRYAQHLPGVSIVLLPEGLAYDVPEPQEQS